MEATSALVTQAINSVLTIRPAMVGLTFSTNIFKLILIVVFYLDVNECSTNNGNCDQMCTNTNGSYACSCGLGYMLSSDNSTCNGGLKICTYVEMVIFLHPILDVDECSLLNGNCSQMCNNTIGSYMCSCITGYFLNSNNRICNGMSSQILKMYAMATFITSEINECSTNNGNCSQLCTNTNGSYFCSCNHGYVLNGNNMTCSGKMALKCACCQ